jgi:hypothetical protein
VERFPGKPVKLETADPPAPGVLTLGTVRKRLNIAERRKRLLHQY